MTTKKIIIDLEGNSIDRRIALHQLQEDFEKRMWTDYAHGDKLERLQCTPCMESAKAVFRELSKTDPERADCVEAAAIGNVWTALRANPKEEHKQKCRRCKMDIETLTHRYWTCPDNCNAKGDALRIANGLTGEAVNNPDDPMWTRGITKGESSQGKPDWIRPQNCVNHITKGLIALVEQLGYIGTDGAGEKLNETPKFRHVGAGAGLCILNDNGEIETEAIWANVPGKQTVPRAECWGVCIWLLAWNSRPADAIQTEI